MTDSFQIRNSQSAIRNLVECVPNFSEGRKPETVQRIERAIESIHGARVLDRHIDPDHNRSVITFVAPPEHAIEAGLRAVAAATELIDLRTHAGEHPRTGAIAVGARPFLIAFNVNLQTNDIAVARSIARAIRESGGGLPFVKALGFELRTRGFVQVSMNLTDYEQTTIARAFDAVETEANLRGVEVAGAEIVGLLPRAALDRGAPYFPRLENFL